MNVLRRAVLRSLSKDSWAGSLREYRPGEDARGIDWPALARTGSLQVRDRARDRCITWGAVVDSSRSMEAGRHVSLSEAAAEAAAFWFACTAPGDRRIQRHGGGRFNLTRALQHMLRAMPSESALLAAGDFFDLPDVPLALLRAAAQRFDCTAVIARDPWRDDFPVRGFAVFVDLESRATRRFYVGSRERARFMHRARARECETLALFRRAGWRAATFDESDGARAVVRAFGAA